ncbi:Integrase [Acanthamoeba castellanii str. Neff]|uniref:Integrase n=1 Tax=Acanthamoeba castellanii (strain ATCC 30010 / Neff) TaxID=1257118 RepID=L8GPU4_ACACF|nr:Integrase [Acanthamoeba castellanii str. Neff]ELR14658.1 Integrase [Acanthamoeba castellanii str. Neff]
MTCNQAWLHSYKPLPVNRVTLSNNTMINTVSTSTINSFTTINRHDMSLMLTGVLHVPQLEKLQAGPCLTLHVEWPMPVESFSWQLYFVTFIDDCTRYAQVHLMCHKSEVLSKLQAFIAVHKIHGREWMVCCGIQHVTAPTYSPEHNGVAEWYNCTVMNMVRSMLLDAGLVNWFWAEALNTVVYINNCMPSRSIDNKDPFQLLHRRAPDILKLQLFGCCTYILTPVQMCNKLQDCSCEAVYLGLLGNGTHHRLWVHSSGTITESHDVIFCAPPAAAPCNLLATLWIPKLKTTTITPLVDEEVNNNKPELLNTTHTEGDDFTVLEDNEDALSPPTSPNNILGEWLSLDDDDNDNLHGHKAMAKPNSAILNHDKWVVNDCHHHTVVTATDTACITPNSYTEAIASKDTNQWIDCNEG